MEILKNLLKKIGLYKWVVLLWDWSNLQLQTLKLIVLILTKPNQENTYLFFPFYHTGGAEKVHLDISKAISKQKPWIIFTNTSQDSSLLFEFQKNGPTFDLSYYFNRSYFLGICLKKALIYRINHSNRAITFGGNCLLYYKLVGKFNSSVTCIDLIHAFVHRGEIGAEYVSLPVADRLDKRITINSKTKKDFGWLYQENGLPEYLNDRISVIQNTVKVPEYYTNKIDIQTPQIAFVSRNSPEKRVELVGRIACELHKNFNIKIWLIGPGLENGIEPENRKFCNFVGNITEEQELKKWYEKIHILVLCSTREGMPMVIMEAMAHSAVCISTNVGGISDHIINGKNGFLIEWDDDSKVVEEFCKKTSQILFDPALFLKISQKSYSYAKTHFNPQLFEESWSRILTSPKA
jgi:glycosyltransferase involved in cell wall biosynthesis